MRRELREEAGVEIEVGRLVATVPDTYGDSGEATINAFFECRLVSGDPQPDDDVAELRWFEPDALPRPEELAFDVRARGARGLALASRLRAARRARAGASGAPSGGVFLLGVRRSERRTSGPVVTCMRSVCTVRPAGT